MRKTKRIIAAVTAAIITAASTSLMSVCADDNGGSDPGFISKSTTDKSDKIEKVESDAQLYDKLGQLLKQGDYLKYGEALYTTGTPDGEKWTKEFYEQRVEFYGEDLLAKYIVDGEFLRKSVESDMNGLLIKTANELDKYVEVINEFLTEKSIAGSAYLIKSDGIDKLLITYDGNLDKIKAFVNETGLDENLVVYSQAQDMVVTKPAATIAVTETKPVTTITMPVVDDPTIQTAVVKVTIMDVSGDNILVKPVDGSPELNSSDKFYLSSKKLTNDIKPKVGMKLEITYNGGILETYPAQFGNVKKVVEVKEDTVKEDPTLLKGTKDMTLNDVMRLAELGDDLDWADFRDYKGRDVGSGLYIWEYKLEDGFVLDVGGTTSSKPLYILLSHDNDKGIDIRTEDVKEYIASKAIDSDETDFSGITAIVEPEKAKELFNKYFKENNVDAECIANETYPDYHSPLVVEYVLETGTINGKQIVEFAEKNNIERTLFRVVPIINGERVYKVNADINLSGDTNCDGSFDMADAVLIMQSIANPTKFGIEGTNENHLTEQGKINGDIAGENDGITNADALAIQKKLLGLDKTNDPSIISSLIADKIFTYAKSADPGIYDDCCTLSFGSNGQYFYHIGYYTSSNQDQGTWEISGDTLVLTGQYGTNKFRYEDKALVYIAEESDGFSEFNDKSTPKDGEKFILAEEPNYAAMNNLSEIVTIKTDYNPIMSDWSGIGILVYATSSGFSLKFPLY